jgi:hypothetical protein
MYRCSLAFSLAALLWPSAVVAQDEPGAPAAPGAPTSRAVATVAGLDGLLARAERQCRPGRRCEQLPQLLAALARPAASLRVMPTLGRSGDPRAVGPLGWLAVYGSKTQQAGARRALRRLARVPVAARALRRLASDVDPALRTQARALLKGVVTGPVAQAIDVERGASRSGRRPVVAARVTQPKAPRSGVRASEPSRVIYGASAIVPPAGSFTWSAHNLGVHFLDYAVSEHVEVGVGFALPVMVYGFMARLKLSAELRPGVRAGVLLTGGAFGSYVDEHRGLGAYGGGPVLTFGSERLFVNASFIFGARSTYGDEESCYRGYCSGDDADNTRWIGLGNLGVSWRAARWARLNLELFMPLHQEADGINGQLVVMMYGLRIFGEHIFGDIAMMLLFHEELIQVHKYMPLGVPYLTFGYRW